jgi:hypothetical protein
MTRTCAVCEAVYDDAVGSTICPHRRFLSEADQQQKDLALSLLGHELRWTHLPDGPPVRIQSVGWNGMVTLDGWTGEFAPHLFRQVS